ncbi:MAG: lactate racemase domain-containing protein [Lachnospiraceae bacterium]|nr:lactate racemase domain-containing protein [Lachnospiraceae bacterium]
MADFHELLAHITIPEFVKVRYKIEQQSLTNLQEAMQDALDSAHVLTRVQKGMRIAVTAGSRQMGEYPVLLKALIDILRQSGADVFLVPAMGSHGGATAEGQKAVLAEYGITEAAMGVPICSSMETVSLGVAENGMEVRMDRYAYGADGIVVFNRIKAHTGFRGPVESGLMKMITIGLGKQHGANICHSDRPENMSENIHQIAAHALTHAPILFGVGVIENAFHMPYKIAAMGAEDIWQEEQKLLLESKALMPRIPFKQADVLFLDEIGKDIAGEGMDPNITGRSFFIGNREPNFESIAVLDITDASEGNGTGIGNADVISKRAYDKFRMDMTYPNCITSRDAKSTKIPVTMPCDKLAFQYALQICYGIDREKGARIVWLKNTLRLDTFYISTALLDEARENPDLEILGNAVPVIFDENDNVIQHDY